MKTVLAYSGGLDTSFCVKWIQERYKSDVITVTFDVGQGKDLDKIKKRAENLGVLKHYSIDSKRGFVTDYVFPAVRANALYEGVYPLHSALSRPLIASKLVEIAEKEGAEAVAHGCTGKGNDQVRFDVTIKSLAPDLKIIAPIRESSMSRDMEVAYLKNLGLAAELEPGSEYSIDQNLWGRSIECGPLEYLEKEPPEAEVFKWTKPIEKTPDKPDSINIEFVNGIPVAFNNSDMDPVTLIKRLNHLASEHGIGRIDHVEDRLVGIKSREVYECPVATLVITAHKDLEKTVLTRHEVLFKQMVDAKWAELVYTGLWMDPLREDLEAFIEETQKRVEGEVKLKLFKGLVQVVGRSSPYSIYDRNLATYNVDTTFNQKAAVGFIELWGLPTITARSLRRKSKLGEEGD